MCRGGALNFKIWASCRSPNSNDIKKSWGVIKSIINKNQKPHIQGRFKIGENLITIDNELISNKFNDFFINIGPSLAKSIPHVNKSPLIYLGSRLTESIYLAPVSENEIGQLIKSLKDTAAGFDDLNAMCLKNILKVSCKAADSRLQFVSFSRYFPRTVEDCKCYSFI